jgi:hypothetical protein
MAQPLVRGWGHARNRAPAQRSSVPAETAPRPTGRAAGRVFIYDVDRNRSALAAALIAHLRRGGLRVLAASGGWEDYDARIAAGPFVWGEMVSTEHPAGCIQVRVRRRPRRRVLAAAVVAMIAASILSSTLFVAVAAAVAAGALWGMWRTGPFVGRLLMGGTS